MRIATYGVGTLGAAISALALGVVPAVAVQTNPPAAAAPAAPSGSAYNRGMDAYQKGDLENARTLLDQAVTSDPQNGDAQAVLGFLQAQAGQYETAIAHLEKATALKTTLITPTSSLMNLGKALLMRPNHSPDDTTRAIDLFDKAAALSPKSAEPQMNLGFGYTREANYDKALAAYRQATVLAPKSAGAWKSLGVTLHHMGQNDEAADALQKSTALNSGDSDAWATLGEIDLVRGDNAGAQNALETARKLSDKDAGVLIQLGILYSHESRPGDAAEAYGAAGDLIEAGTGTAGSVIPAGIDLAKLRYDQGAALGLAGKNGEAATAYDKALALNPRYTEALLNSGTLLFDQGKYDEAIARFTTATTVQPTSAIAWKNLAAAYTRKSDTPNTIKALRKVAALQPTNYDIRDALVTAMLQVNPTSTDAVAVYKQMIALHPHSADPLIGLGLLYERQVETVSLASQKQARLLAALDALQTAISREPKSAIAYNDLGVVHERRGEMAEAIAAYHKAAALDPTLVDAKKNLARFHAPATPVGGPAVKRP